MRQVRKILIAFGANLKTGDFSLSETILAAAKTVVTTEVNLVAMSRLFASPCFPVGAGPDYVNAAGLFETALGPEQVLAHLHRVETDFRRERLLRWGRRTLDLDLLAMEDVVLPNVACQTLWRNLPSAEQSVIAPDRLILPHPRLQDRAFVLVPMAEIAPDWRHPVLGLTVMQMLAALDPSDIGAVVPISHL